MARPRNNSPKAEVQKTPERQQRLEFVAGRPKVWHYVLHSASSRQPVTRVTIASFANCPEDEAEQALQEAANMGWYRKVPLSTTEASIYGYSGQLPK